MTLSALPDTGPLGYEPLGGGWICDEHGQIECRQTERCRALPWAATEDDRLRQFMDWADAQGAVGRVGPVVVGHQWPYQAVFSVSYSGSPSHRYAWSP